MRKLLECIGLICLVLSFTACSSAEKEPAAPADVSLVPKTSVAETEIIHSKMEQRTEAEAVSQREPDRIPSDPVTVDGVLLPDGSVEIEGNLYVSLRDVVSVLETDMERCDKTAHFSWKEKTVAAASGCSAAEISGKMVDLGAPIYDLDGSFWVPLELLDRLGLRRFYDAEQKHLYFSDLPEELVMPGYSVPVLMYHGVSDDTWGSAELFVSPSDLDKQLQYLGENGYTTIFFSDLARIHEIKKPVILTFDDGYLDNYTQMYPILQSHGAKATIFAITRSIGTHPKFFNWDQAREMVESKLVEIHSHTASHADLSALTYEQQLEEMEESKLELLRQTGRESYVLAYPFGNYNGDTLRAASVHYELGLRAKGYTWTTGPGVYEVTRWYVPRGISLESFADMLE